MAIGCPAATVVDRPSGANLSEVEAAIFPYDLTGPTARGLWTLEAWIDDSNAVDRPAGYTMRADVLLDLWVYAELVAGRDDEASERALAMIADVLVEAELLQPLVEDVEDVEDVETSWLAAEPRGRLREALSQSVQADYERGGVHREVSDVADQILAFDIHAPDAAQQFGQWRETNASPARLRLLLAALLHREAPAWLLPGDERSTETFYERFAWLCSGEGSDSAETLAGRCGYWCTDIEAGAPPNSEAPEGWRPTPGDRGYELVSLCGADYFGLPDTGGTVLLDEANFVDLVYLEFVGQLMTGIEDDLLRGDPLTVLATDLIAEYSSLFLAGAVRQGLTPAAYRHDPRLELPRQLGASQATEPDETALRVISVLADGVYVGLAPHIALERRDYGGYGLSYAEGDYHYPGMAAVRFERLNRLSTHQVVDASVPALANTLSDLEERLAAIGWQPERAREPMEDSPCSTPSGANASLLIDGATYASTLVPLVATLVGCGYATLRFHAHDAETGALVTLPVNAAVELPERVHRLDLGDSRFALTLVGDDEAYSLGHTEQAPALALYQYIEAAHAEGRLEGELPLLIRITHGYVDWGTVVNVVSALSHRRSPDAPERDIDLLSASVAEGTWFSEILLDASE